MKRKSTIKLTGMVNGTHCTSQNCSLVDEFVGKFDDHKITLYLNDFENIHQLFSDTVELGHCVKHSSQNYYYGVTDSGNKFQVTVKKMVAHLRVWH